MYLLEKNMIRSKWKSPYVNINILNDFYNNQEKIIYTKSRNSVILKQFVGWTFYIYSGNKYNKLLITNFMINKKLGEFCFTRRIGKIHTSKDKKNKKR